MRASSISTATGLLATLVTAAMCQRAPHGSSDPRVAAAKRVAAAYIAADTAGQWQTADSLVDWRGCDFDPATDYLQLTVAARVTDATVRGDTVDVTLEYDVLGRAWSDDPKRAGAKYWHFAAQRLRDRLVLHVLPFAHMKTPIVCGEYQPNHVALSQMTEEILHMDDASHAALEQARATRE
jgi:hypothetical protein